MHFISGAIIALLMKNNWLIAVLLAGAGKETYDYFFGGNVDVFDFIWTVLGGLAMKIIINYFEHDEYVKPFSFY